MEFTPGLVAQRPATLADTIAVAAPEQMVHAILVMAKETIKKLNTGNQTLHSDLVAEKDGPYSYVTGRRSPTTRHVEDVKRNVRKWAADGCGESQTEKYCGS